MLKPKVSVVVPAFNRAGLIEETIASVIHQTYDNWELIVVDDGSEDGTVEVVRNIASNNTCIKMLQRVDGIKGANRCRNLGLDASTGEYIIFLDSDDVLLPDALEQRVKEILTDEGVDFVVSRSAFFTKQIQDAEVWWNIPDERNDLDRFLVLDTVWQTTGPTWRKDFLQRNNLYFDEALLSSQDWDFHVRALLLNPVYRHIGKTPDNFIRRCSGIQAISTTHSNHEKMHNRLLHYQKLLQLDAIKNNQERLNRLLFSSLLESIRYLQTGHELTDGFCMHFMVKNESTPRAIKKMQRYLWMGNHWLHFHFIFYRIFRKFFFSQFVKEDYYGISKYRTPFTQKDKDALVPQMNLIKA